MSRLDDELKMAFRREEPSGDFADRVLARITTAPPARAVPQQRRLLSALATAITLPRFRWAAAGVLVLILATIAAMQYFGPSRHGGVSIETPIAEAPPAPSGNSSEDSSEGNTEVQLHKPLREPPPTKQPRAKHNSRQRQPVPQDRAAAKSEGEVAKEQLMLALHIASAKLNQAQRVVQGEETSKTEYKQ